jgi:hypothetical protein
VTVPTSEQRLPLAPAGSFGEYTEARTGTTLRHALVCFLTAPLPTESRIDYVVISAEDADEYVWSFTHGTKGWRVDFTADGGLAHLTVPAPGQLEAKVVIRKDASTLATLSLTQNVAAPGAGFTPLPEGAVVGQRQAIFALREICEELKGYIDDAAAATGANGIPARLLAAVLFLEASYRPKDGSPRAMDIRKQLSGDWYTPRLDAVLDNLRGKPHTATGRPPQLDDIREEELALIRDFINGSDWDPSYAYASGKTLGVGQIAQTTAAMVLGKTTWREPGVKTKSSDLKQIESDFTALTVVDKVDVFNSLRFPKRNVWVAAKLLEKLKNRTNRFPALSAKDVLTNDQAIEVLATEYNGGPRPIATADVTVRWYGETARTLVRTPSIKGLERFFPDPP